MKIALLNILFGFVIAALGLAVSIGSYAAVSRSGGHYVVAWGAVVVGAWRIVLGLSQLLRASFTAEGRASLWRLLRPSGTRGWLVRLAIVLVAAVAFYLVAPEAWTTMSPAPLQTYAERNEVKSIAYSPDGRWMALGLGYGGLALIDVKTAEHATTPALAPYSDIQAVAFSPDGRLLAAVSSNGLRVWANQGSGNAPWGGASSTLVIDSKEGSYGVAFSPDGRSLATGSVLNGVILWDLGHRAIRWRSSSSHSVDGVAFSRDGKTVASGGNDEVQLWDVETGKLVKTLHTAGFTYRPFTTIAFLGDGRLVAASYQQPDVWLWDTKSGALLHTFRSSSRMRGGGTVWSVAAAPDDRWIVGGQSDGSMRFWDTGSDRPFRTIFGHIKDVRSIALSPDGSHVASGGSDQMLKVYAAP